MRTIFDWNSFLNRHDAMEKPLYILRIVLSQILAAENCRYIAPPKVGLAVSKSAVQPTRSRSTQAYHRAEHSTCGVV